MKPRYDKTDRLSFWFILPTTQLRDLVIRRMRQQFPSLNYVIGWKDVGGWGLEMTIAEWVPVNHCHINLR